MLYKTVLGKKISKNKIQLSTGGYQLTYPNNEIEFNIEGYFLLMRTPYGFVQVRFLEKQ